MRVLALVSVATLAVAYPAYWFDASRPSRGKCIAPKAGDIIMNAPAVSYQAEWTTKLYKSGDRNKVAVSSWEQGQSYNMDLLNAQGQYLLHITGATIANAQQSAVDSCKRDGDINGATYGSTVNQPVQFIFKPTFTGPATITIAVGSGYKAVKVQKLTLAGPAAPTTKPPAPTNLVQPTTKPTPPTTKPTPPTTATFPTPADTKPTTATRPPTDATKPPTDATKPPAPTPADTKPTTATKPPTDATKPPAPTPTDVTKPTTATKPPTEATKSPAPTPSQTKPPTDADQDPCKLLKCPAGTSCNVGRDGVAKCTAVPTPVDGVSSAAGIIPSALVAVLGVSILFF